MTTKHIFASVTALLISTGLLLMGNGLQMMLLPLRAQMEGFSPFSIGIMGSSYYLGFVVGCLLGPWAIRRVGHIRAFAAMVSLASAVALLHLLLISPAGWWLFRAFTGFCIAGLYLVIESWLNDRATNETRGLIMSSYIMVSLGVWTLGQLLVAVANPSGPTLFLVASILVSLAAIPVAFTRSKQPTPPRLTRLRLRKLYKTSPAGFVGCFSIGLANGSIWSLGPLYTSQSGYSVAETAIFMSLIVAVGALTQVPVGRLSDHVDRRVILAWLFIFAAGFGMPLWLLSDLSRIEVFALAIGIGAFAMPAYSIATAHAFDHTPQRRMVQTSAGLLLINGVGSVLGPLLAAGLMGAMGPGALFLFTALVHLGAAVYLIQRITRRKALHTTDKTDYDMTTAPTAAPAPMPTIPEGVDATVVAPRLTEDKPSK
jgi:MFS family permease